MSSLWAAVAFRAGADGPRVVTTAAGAAGYRVGWDASGEVTEERIEAEPLS